VVVSRVSEAQKPIPGDIVMAGERLRGCLEDLALGGLLVLVVIIAIPMAILFPDKPKQAVLSGAERAQLTAEQQELLLAYRQARYDYQYRLRSTPGLDFAPFHEPWSVKIIRSGDQACRDRIDELKGKCRMAGVPDNLL
jgi:hypothetical protein